MSNKVRGYHATSPTFQNIIAGLAVEDRNGKSLGDTAIDDGDFVPLDTPTSGGNAVRQRTVQAAILAVGRSIADISAHECGHSLGIIEHNTIGQGFIMDDGNVQVFGNTTGFVSFDPATGKFQVDPVSALSGFTDKQLKELAFLRIF